MIILTRDFFFGVTKSNQQWFGASFISELTEGPDFDFDVHGVYHTLFRDKVFSGATKVIS